MTAFEDANFWVGFALGAMLVTAIWSSFGGRK